MKTINEAANVFAFSGSYTEAVQKEFSTREINGFIEYIIIRNSKPISIDISPEEFPSVDLYHNQSMNAGEHFLPIRIQGISNTGELINYSSYKYLSNGPLKFMFKMPAGTEIEVRVVYG